ncbi:MAG: hypothetical protein V1806_07555 [Pseudomonadota bacterium]
MKRKPGFTLARHEELGIALQPIRDFLVHLSVEIDNTYPRQSREALAARKAADAVDLLQCKLDDAVFRENPGIHSYAGHSLAAVYYRQDRRKS